MLELLTTYWPHMLTAVSIVTGTIAAIHAIMTKEDVRAAAGWVGVILLSPLVGALVYAVAGINRIRHRALATRKTGRRTFDKQSDEHSIEPERIEDEFGPSLAAMNRLGDRVTRFFMTEGNSIEILEDGDAAYGAMIDAIDGASRFILLESYIFDRDGIGKRVAEHLVAAAHRGVEVRVLVDAVGARYSFPSIVTYLRQRGINARTFNGRVITGLRLPYANLRTHRKIMVVDGEVGFMGGMNIRQRYTREFGGSEASQDTHFKVSGPVVRDLYAVSSEDWHYTTGERLPPAEPQAERGKPTFIRVVSSGPDASLETNQKMLIGAFTMARQTIRIMSPYFLPDRELVSALATAARRGVRIDIVVPKENNLHLVDLAMMAQFDQVVKNGCHVWRSAGTFNHSKLLTIDGIWSFVGSSNMDPRSMRLNFEVDLEVLDQAFAGKIARRIDKAIEGGREVLLSDIRERRFPRRLIEKTVWLGSPYL